MVRRAIRFLREDIWRIRLRSVPRPRFWLLRLVRVTLLACRGFTENRGQLRASALTYYTLLSIVPVLAAGFGIAQGFGLQERLREYLTRQLRGQEEVLSWFLRFTDSLLADTEGGLVAGVGVIFLFWAVIGLLGHVEHAFNDVWGVRQGRPLSRKVTDYLALLLICPVILAVTGSVTVFLAGPVAEWAARTTLFWPLRGTLLILLGLFPFVVLWLLLGSLYRYMPYTRVSLPAAMIAGVVAGTVYQITQWAYVYFQIGVTRYNAIYGGFAALPLFLIWLQASWLIVLFGAEVSFAIDNEATYEFEQESASASQRLKSLVAVRIAQVCAERFEREGGPLTEAEIAQRLEAPIRLVRDRLFELTAAGMLAEVNAGPGGTAYLPAMPPGGLTIAGVLAAMSRRGLDQPSMLNADELAGLERRFAAMEQAVRDHPANAPLGQAPEDDQPVMESSSGRHVAGVP